MNRLWLAMAILAVLAALAWNTLSDDKIRYATVIVIGLFAVKLYIGYRRREMDERIR